MTDPLVAPVCSVVVPTYNRAAALAMLLDRLEEVARASAVAGLPIEVVVVDDGSVDATSSVIAGRTWIVGCHQPNAGAAAARNHGWQVARAPIVAFIDDDCVPGAGWPGLLLPPFDDAGVGGVGGAIHGLQPSALASFVEAERLVDHGRDVDGTVDYLATANAAYRRTALEAVDGFDESFPGAAGEDVDLAWRVRDAGWTLVRSPAEVRHDHRAALGSILRSYAQHGRARARLDQRPGRPATASARRVLSVSEVQARWDRFRADGWSWGTSVGLVALRYIGLTCYAASYGWHRLRP